MAIQKIVVPTDFSPSATVAAETGLALAKRFAAELTLLHVSLVPEYALMAVEPMYVPPKVWEHLSRREVEHVAAELDSARARLTAQAGDVVINTVHHRGNPVEGIVEYAAQSQADLLVIGSHGAGGSLRFLFGSVAGKVAREAPCRVLVTRPDTPLPAEPRRVLAAIDYSKFSQPCVEAALDLVGEEHSIVELVHVWQPPPLLSAEVALNIEDARSSEVERMTEFAAAQELGGEQLVPVVETGSPAPALLERAERMEAELIVVGSHGRHGIERLVGTVADRVLRHARVPVLLIPEGALGGERDADREDTARYGLQ